MIQVISCSHPAVVGVDWRSWSWSPADMDRLKSSAASTVRIVWARERYENGEIGGVAGGVSLPPNWSAGVAAVPQDYDRAVRRHSRWLEDGRETFSWALMKEYCAYGDSKQPSKHTGCRLVARCAEKENCPAQALLNYRNGSDHINQFPAEALPGQELQKFDSCAAIPEAQDNPFIKGQIVLIGGVGSADLHDTPYGPKPGVAIVAHAIQSDLFGDGLVEKRGILVYVLHIISALIVIMVNRIPWPLVALCLNVFGLPLLALAFSYAAFRSYHHWFDFIPILGGVIIHQLYEQARENQRLRSHLSADR
jgi:CHASE2 domain-containing sensor protein